MASDQVDQIAGRNSGFTSQPVLHARRIVLRQLLVLMETDFPFEWECAFYCLIQTHLLSLEVGIVSIALVDDDAIGSGPHDPERGIIPTNASFTSGRVEV